MIMPRANRRTFLVAAGSAVFLAGCSSSSSSGAEESGTATESTIHNVEVEEGETLRIEADNEQGYLTFVIVDDPDDEEIVNVEVETEDTITHEAQQSGDYRVWIIPDREASYEIHID